MNSDQNVFWYDQIHISGCAFWIFQLPATERYESLVIKAEAENSEHIF